MTSTTYRVIGMTCQHCVTAVSSELASLDGVTDVRIDLDPAGTSTVQVASAAPLTTTQVTEALDEAGEYQLQS